MIGKPVAPESQAFGSEWSTMARESPVRTAKLAERDLTLDLVRVGCVLLVVVVHLLLAGVSLGDEGVQIEKTLEQQSWFNLVSFVFQIMPAFFLVGGFAAMTGWDSLVRRNPGQPFRDSASAFVRVRLARLARPAVAVMGFFAVTLLIAKLIGAPPELVDAVASGVGSPMWFLAAYMIAQAAAPWMIRAHRARPILALAVIALLAVATDALRFASGVTILGLPNTAFVWLFAQQLGFWYRDGWFQRRSPLALLGLVALSYALAIAAVWAVPMYSWNMLANQFPPTVPLMVLALSQGALLALCKRPLAALMRTRIAQGIVFIAGTRLMTIYLWHLPVIMAVIGVQLLAPEWLSEPGSARWWFERIPMYVLVLGLVYLLSLVLGRLEAAPAGLAHPRFPGLPVALAAVAAFVPGPMLIMVFGLDVINATVSLVGSAAALVLVTGRAPESHRRHRLRA